MAHVKAGYITVVKEYTLPFFLNKTVTITTNPTAPLSFYQLLSLVVKQYWLKVLRMTQI